MKPLGRREVSFTGVVIAAVIMGWPPAAAAPTCRLDAASTQALDKACTRAWMDANLHLNDLAAVGTHNSYKLALPRQIAEAIGERAAPLDYAHRPLTEQLDAGARQLELDVYADPHGGRFADPARYRAAGLALDAEMVRALQTPGFKVFHAPDSEGLLERGSQLVASLS